MPASLQGVELPLAPKYGARAPAEGRARLRRLIFNVVPVSDLAARPVLIAYSGRYFE